MSDIDRQERAPQRPSPTEVRRLFGEFSRPESPSFDVLEEHAAALRVVITALELRQNRLEAALRSKRTESEHQLMSLPGRALPQQLSENSALLERLRIVEMVYAEIVGAGDLGRASALPSVVNRLTDQTLSSLVETHGRSLQEVNVPELLEQGLLRSLQLGSLVPPVSAPALIGSSLLEHAVEKRTLSGYRPGVLDLLSLVPVGAQAARWIRDTYRTIRGEQTILAASREVAGATRGTPLQFTAAEVIRAENAGVLSAEGRKILSEVREVAARNRRGARHALEFDARAAEQGRTTVQLIDDLLPPQLRLEGGVRRLGRSPEDFRAFWRMERCLADAAKHGLDLGGLKVRRLNVPGFPSLNVGEVTPEFFSKSAAAVPSEYFLLHPSTREVVAELQQKGYRVFISTEPQLRANWVLGESRSVVFRADTRFATVEHELAHIRLLERNGNAVVGDAVRDRLLHEEHASWTVMDLLRESGYSPFGPLGVQEQRNIAQQYRALAHSVVRGRREELAMLCDRLTAGAARGQRTQLGEGEVRLLKEIIEGVDDHLKMFPTGVDVDFIRRARDRAVASLRRSGAAPGPEKASELSMDFILLWRYAPDSAFAASADRPLMSSLTRYEKLARQYQHVVDAEVARQIAPLFEPSRRTRNLLLGAAATALPQAISFAID